ncbi:uncharacterized protein LOC117221075 [Megalopta genalis]|uniref:uncharacterized protein LOC117221075 n=1 Tax=Megalopta genalis TaxID=115081 RepID=UPI003FD23DBE
MSDGPCQSVLGKIFNQFVESYWDIWNVSQNKPSACPSKRKKMEEEEAARLTGKSSEGTGEGGVEGRVEAGVGGGVEGEGYAEDYADSYADRSAESESGIEGHRDPSGKRSPYVLPSQICPDSNKSCCFIKMQDPCAPCCCETKPKLPPCPPCPPKYGPQEPRQPICGCNLCQKDPNNSKCCDKNRAFRGISLDARYFEKA